MINNDLLMTVDLNLVSVNVGFVYLIEVQNPGWEKKTDS